MLAPFAKLYSSSPPFLPISLQALRCCRCRSHSARSSSSLPLNSASSSSATDGGTGGAAADGIAGAAPAGRPGGGGGGGGADNGLLSASTKSPALSSAYSCFWMSCRISGYRGSTSCVAVRPALFLMRGLDPASSIISISACANGCWAGGSEFDQRIAVCRGVSRSRREMGSHSKPGWSRRRSMISSV